MPRIHDKQAKARAVARVLAGTTQREIAREMGVSETAVSKWVRNAGASRGRVAGDTHAGVWLGKASLEEAADALQSRQTRVREKALALLERKIESEPQKISASQAAVIYGILTDKDHKHAEAQAKAQIEGRSQGLDHLPREELLKRKHALELLSGRPADIEG